MLPRQPHVAPARHYWQWGRIIEKRMSSEADLTHAAATTTTDYVRFAVIGDARTGSTMLVHGLDDHPQIVCFREVFNFLQDFVDYHVDGYDPRIESQLALRKEQPERFLRECIFTPHPEGTKAVGFKILYKHIVGNPAVEPVLAADAELRAIHIKRRNLLRAFVSTLIAQRTGRWVELDHRPEPPPIPKPLDVLDAFIHPRRAWRKANEGYRRWRPPEESTGPYARTDPAARGVPFTLSREECVEFFERARRDEAHWDALFADHETLVVYYEDFLVDQAREFEKAQRFLGATPRKVFADTRRQNPEPLRQLIANYDELRAQFAGSEAEAFFDS
jgi:hypothetical protein